MQPKADRRNIRAHADGAGEAREFEWEGRVDIAPAIDDHAPKVVVADEVRSNNSVQVLVGAAESLVS